VGSDNPVNKFMQSNRPLGATSEFEYLREFENEFENNFGYCGRRHNERYDSTGLFTVT
jgi:hypothetical protein